MYAIRCQDRHGYGHIVLRTHEYDLALAVFISYLLEPNDQEPIVVFTFDN